MTASPTRRQLAFLLGSLLLAPLVTLYATQAVWLQSLWAPLPWRCNRAVLGALLQSEPHPLRLFPPAVSRLSAGSGRLYGGGRHQPV